MEKNIAFKTCPECHKQYLIMDVESGELVCEKCGYVISTTIFDHGPEWRAFNNEQREKRTRMGAPLTWTMHDRGLSTIIDRKNRDVYGRKLKPMQQAKVYRLRKWQRRSNVSGSTDRNLAYALSEITKMAFKLNLPKNVLETASVIYRRIVKKRLIKGRSIQGVATASIYMACRRCKVIRSLEEIAKVANITKKECARNYRFILRKLKIRIPRADIRRHISKFVNQLKLPGKVETIATKILDQAISEKLTSGRGPSGMAAACTYIAGLLAGEGRTQGDIARKANVTEVTIRNRYKEIIRSFNFKVEL